jgi:predicted MFS family arabinose efflux permease
MSDRYDRRGIVQVANVARAGVLGVLVAAMLTAHLSVVGALVALGLVSTAEVFADNTTGTLLPMLVGRDELHIANSRLLTGFVTMNQLAGPALGAFLFAAGRVWPFVSEGALVVLGVLAVSRVVLPPHGHEPGTGPGVRQEVLEGLRWTWRHAAVRTLVLTILTFNVTFGAAWSVLVLYTTRVLGLGPAGFGLLTTVSAAGGLLGTSLYGAITRRVSLGALMRIGLVIETLTHLGLAVTRSAWIAGAILFVFGAHAFIWGTTSVTVRQRAVPHDLQGRVNSINTIATFGGTTVGAVVGGVLAARIGVLAPFWFAFAGSALLVVVLWRQFARIAHDD